MRSVRRQTGVTVLHVTHNRSEATHLADRLFLLKDGAIHEQRLAPAQDYVSLMEAMPVEGDA